MLSGIFINASLTMEVTVLRHLVNLGSRVTVLRMTANKFKKITEIIFRDMEPTASSLHVLRVR